MDKKIKSVEFGLNTYDMVLVPIECFKSLCINGEDELSNGNDIKNFDCLIALEDKEKIKYSTPKFRFETQEAYDKLFYCDDITQIKINYIDDTYINLYVEWGEPEYGSNVDDYNPNQLNGMTFEGYLHIMIEGYENEGIN